MIAHRHVERIVAAVVALGLVGLILLMVYGPELLDAEAAEQVDMEYETSLFADGEILTVDIQMEAADWEEMLADAISETWYACDVVINGVTYSNVGIRCKGNTSLSQVYSSDSDRYSLKLEFDRYISGQTCDGLDKLVLNNNMADATYLKEYLVYDMFEYLGADASLCTFADVSVNGETWGLYLALEAVEESFVQRNYGAQYGNLYKPDSMNMGGAGGMEDFDMEDFSERFQEEWGGFEQGQAPERVEEESAEESAPEESVSPEASGESEEAEPVPAPAGEATPEAMPEGETEDFSQAPDAMAGMPGLSQGEAPELPEGEMPELPAGETAGTPEASETPSDEEAADTGGDTPTEEDAAAPEAGAASGFDGGRGGGPDGGGGFSADTNGSDLNYVDDNLDSYSAIWDGSVFGTDTDSDHERVVEALKEICAGGNLEEYCDVDAILRYMAVQTFVVNLDSLTGNMAHNYYLYEEDGVLSIIPWDYNLAFGGYTSSSADEVVNFPIDTPFTTGLEDRQFFAAFLENEEYLAQYHTYLRMLAQEYVLGGEFSRVYTQIRSQIDTLVENDPTAFYTYDEYTTGADALYTLITLRAESVLGQLAGTIPSTTQGQQADSSALIDASAVNLSDLGSMSDMMGGMGQGGGFAGDAPENTGEADTGGGEEGRAAFAGAAVPDMGGAALRTRGDSGLDSSGEAPVQSAAGNQTALYVLAGCLGLALAAILGAKAFHRRM